MIDFILGISMIKKQASKQTNKETKCGKHPLLFKVLFYIQFLKELRSTPVHSKRLNFILKSESLTLLRVECIIHHFLKSEISFFVSKIHFVGVNMFLFFEWFYSFWSEWRFHSKKKKKKRNWNALCPFWCHHWRERRSIHSHFVHSILRSTVDHFDMHSINVLVFCTGCLIMK